MSSPTMSSGGSDIEMQSALSTHKKMPKMPMSPSEDILEKQEKKLTTKMMVNQALVDLKSRKGVSLYAIKKYIKDTFSLNTEKSNYLIKKYLKSAVEEGTIIQTKGIGATGSFKLVINKEKKSKPKKPAKEKSEKKKDPEKKKLKEKPKEIAEKSAKTKTKLKEGKEEKSEKPKKKIDKEKNPKVKISKEKNGGEEKVKKVKIAKGMQTPAKKKTTMMKRKKSIGSIIKPPKMNPKANA